MQLIDSDPDAQYYVTARIETYAASDTSKRYGHTVNIQGVASDGIPIIVDPSSRNRTRLDSREHYERIDLFETDKAN